MAGGKVPPHGPLAQQVTRTVRRLREQRGLSYVELSGLLGETDRPIAPLGLRRLERGDRRVDVDELAALAQVLGVPEPWDLTQASSCDTCMGTPSAGFTCNSCGRDGAV